MRASTRRIAETARASRAVVSRLAVPHRNGYFHSDLPHNGFIRSFSSGRQTNMPLTLEKLNQNVVDAKYAVRGRLALRAEQLRDQLKLYPSSLPFEEVINANIGNPQQLDQKPLTFFRQVAALIQYPQLMENEQTASAFPSDVIARAKRLLADIGSVGAYSHSKGATIVRKSVANFLEKRDGFPADPENIYLTTGASAGVTKLLNLLAKNANTAVMVPIPQYPLYTATLTLCDSTCVQYYLDESANWSCNAEYLEEVVENTKAEGLDLHALVVINPGNPTGSVLTEDNISKIIELAAKHHIVIIADEVYQTNVFKGKFVSFKKVLRKMQKENPGKYDQVELASIHSISKGMIGECGQRSGYMELVGFSEDVLENTYKLASINLCPPVTGQALMELMVNPPKEGEPSYELYKKEYDHTFRTLEERAMRLFEAFKKMDGVTCNQPEGAMYLFPRIQLPEKAIEASKKAGFECADEFYCMELLEKTGVCVIPGSGFGQEPGTYHFRTTFLAPGSDYADRMVKFHQDFMKKYL